MQCTTKRRKGYWGWGSVAHSVAVLSLLALTVTGVQLEGMGGWIACPPGLVVLTEGKRKKPWRLVCCNGFAWRAGWCWLRQSWMVVVLRSEALLGLAWLTGGREWVWVWVLPWVAWLWKGLGVACPVLGRHAVYGGLGRAWERAGSIALVGLGLVWLSQRVEGGGSVGAGLVGWGVGMCTGEPHVEVEQDEAGVYHVRLSGTFEMEVDGDVEFYKRVLVVFLGRLEAPGETRGSRRTRDGRTPFVREEQLAAWFGVPHPVISRWYSYWLRQDWRRMLSQRRGEVLTPEAQQQVIESWVQFPWWSAERVWGHLRAQGSRITLPQVKQIGYESGWTALRERLSQIYRISAESFHVRDEWLVEELLAQNQRLVEQLEGLGGLTPQEQIALADLEALCAELDVRPAVAPRPLPWVLQLERLLFGHWEWVDDGTVRCIYCGTTRVSRKSRRPRLKQYIDEQGNVQAVEVYRYYCHLSADRQATRRVSTRRSPACRPTCSRIRSGRLTIIWRRCKCTNGRAACIAAPARCSV